MGRLVIPSLLCLVGVATAQRTWIVDQANGPGTNFSDLPPALAAAADGDTLLIRPSLVIPPFNRGGYTPGTTNKGLTLLVSPGAKLDSTNLFATSLTVNGLPQGKTFVLKGGFLWQRTTPPSGENKTPLTLVNCAGRVHIERTSLDVQANSYGEVFVPTVSVANCSHVTFTACSLIGGRAGIEAGNSKISIAGCVLIGANAGWKGGFSSPTYPGVGLSLYHSTAQVAGSWIQGGSCLPGTCIQRAPGQGVVMDASTLTVGTDSSSIAAGAMGVGASPAIFALNGGNVLLDPIVALVPRNRGPPIQGVAPSVRRHPALVALGAPPGGIVMTDLYAKVGEIVLLIASSPADQSVVPPFGELWLDPLNIFFVAVGVQGASQHWSVNIPIAASVPRGRTIALQGLSGPGLDVKLSNPAVVVLD